MYKLDVLISTQRMGNDIQAILEREIALQAQVDLFHTNHFCPNDSVVAKGKNSNMVLVHVYKFHRSDILFLECSDLIYF